MVDGKEIFEKNGIKTAFWNFFSELYKEKLIHIGKLEGYMQKIQIKRLTKEESEELEKPVTREEIIAAIVLSKTGKALRPDGYTAKFYKVFNGFN